VPWLTVPHQLSDSDVDLAMTDIDGDHNDGGDGNGKADGAGDKLAIMPLIA